MIEAFTAVCDAAPGPNNGITKMKAPRLISTLALAGAVGFAVVPSASAVTVPSAAAVSANWSGYQVSAGGSKQFSSVSGSWVQPSPNCTSGQGNGAFWVGLGGAAPESSAMEQVGTEADCGSDGGAAQFAWYELVPAAPVRLNLAISPGDHIWGRVGVAGTAVTVSLADQTTGASATKVLQMNDPDTSSAEWIAEAPSACDGTGSCQPLPLTDFGTVTFSNASATANGHTGTISDPNWTAQPVEFSPDGAGSDGTGFVSSQAVSGAGPSSLSADGSSFSVSAASDDQSSAPSGDYGGSPYADGSGAGDGLVLIYG